MRHQLAYRGLLTVQNISGLLPRRRPMSRASRCVCDERAATFFAGMVQKYERFTLLELHDRSLNLRNLRSHVSSHTRTNKLRVVYTVKRLSNSNVRGERKRKKRRRQRRSTTVPNSFVPRKDARVASM